VLSKSNRKGNLEKQGFISLAANLFVIKDANRSDSFAQISYKRDPYRSVFNLMWKSIFTGVKPLIGIDKKTEQKIKSLKSTKKGKEKAESDGLLNKVKKFLKKTAQKLEGKDRSEEHTSELQSRFDI